MFKSLTRPPTRSSRYSILGVRLVSRFLETFITLISFLSDPLAAVLDQSILIPPLLSRFLIALQKYQFHTIFYMMDARVSFHFFPIILQFLPGFPFTLFLPLYKVEPNFYPKVGLI